MENDNEAHLAPVKIEALDEVLSESQAAPPSPQLAVQFLVPESGCGNLDLPPSPPPLPLVSESLEPEIHDVLSMEMPPHVHQITDEPPLKKRRNMHQKPNQSIKACKIGIETVPPVSGTAEIDIHGEEQMEAQQGSDTIVSTGQRGTITQDTLSDLSQRPSAHFPAVKSMASTSGSNGNRRTQDDLRLDYSLTRTIFPNMTKESISPLCWYKFEEHKIINSYTHTMTTTRNNQMSILYDKRYDPALKRLGLWHVSQLTPIIADVALLSALVERWRPETHTFHLPVGEITVSLQDVSCLWGLPITGRAVTGVEYGDFTQAVVDLLGPGLMKQRTLKKSKVPSKNDISIPYLRATFKGVLRVDADPDTIDRWTRAYIMEIFSCWLFPDSSGSTVPACMLEWLRDLQNPPQMNWGAAVLACLYRGLCTACRVEKPSLYGPIGLLQHWSWTRFPFGRPRPREVGWAPKWGEPDGETCPAYAQRFCTRKTYVETPHGKSTGVQFFRTQFEQMTPDQHVEWRPYDSIVEGFEKDAVLHSFLDDLPSICSRERQYWFAQVPLVYYQVIEHHYPGRVMRQFGMAQYFPVPDPITKDTWYDLHKDLNTAVMKDWRTEHAEHVQRLEAMSPDDMVPDIYQSYAFEEYDQRYRQWYQENCVFTVYMFGQITEINEKLLHIRRDTTSTQYGFIPSAGPAAQIVLMNIKQVLKSVKYGITRGWKKPGKIMLCLSAPLVVVAGYKGHLDKILRLADLPKYEDLANMNDEDSVEPMSTPEPDFSEILSAATPEAAFQQFEDMFLMSQV